MEECLPRIQKASVPSTVKSVTMDMYKYKERIQHVKSSRDQLNYNTLKRVSVLCGLVFLGLSGRQARLCGIFLVSG